MQGKSLPFYKYQGTGNDFIIADAFHNIIPQLSQEQIALMCHRRFGIGADGFMLLYPHEDFDFEMVYYNSDGRTSTMCGNGGRCISHLASLVLNKKNLEFIAVDGPHTAEVEENKVKLSMRSVMRAEREGNDYVLNTGSPHYINLCKNPLEELNLVSEARKIRYNERYEKEGINVNFIRLLPEAVEMRTYERGVEDETLSCGTGVTAAALVASLNDYSSPVSVKTAGGELQVFFERSGQAFENIYLYGPAMPVFEGEYQF